MNGGRFGDMDSSGFFIGLIGALALCTVLLAVRFHKRKERGAMAATIALGSVLFFAAVYYTLVFILIGGIA